jgi:hypothetical protein
MKIAGQMPFPGWTFRQNQLPANSQWRINALIPTDGRRAAGQRTKMRIPGLWRPEVRGNVLRKEYEDLKRRIDTTDSLPKSTFFNFIRSTFGPVSEGYALASSADRRRILKEVREVSRKLWEAGNRPQALALGVIMLNIESEFVPGEDAAFVKEATDALIKKAMA